MFYSTDRAKKNYEKSFRESEKALESFQRADADLNLSRAEVEKQRLQSLYKSQQCEDSKKEYANQVFFWRFEAGSEVDEMIMTS